jgi:hypothetical protein
LLKKLLKVSWFRNAFLLSSILPRNEQIEFDLIYHSSKVEFFFVHFLGELKIPKRYFEINWPLPWDWDSTLNLTQYTQKGNLLSHCLYLRVKGWSLKIMTTYFLSLYVYYFYYCYFFLAELACIYRDFYSRCSTQLGSKWFWSCIKKVLNTTRISRDFLQTLTLLKVSWFQNVFFGVFNSSKKRTQTIRPEVS